MKTFKVVSIHEYLNMNSPLTREVKNLLRDIELERVSKDDDEPKPEPMKKEEPKPKPEAEKELQCIDCEKYINPKSRLIFECVRNNQFYRQCEDCGYNKHNW